MNGYEHFIFILTMFLSKSVHLIFLYYLTIYSCTHCTATNILLLKSNSNMNQPEKCIMKIVTKYFPCNTLLNVLYYESDICYLMRSINSKLCYNVILGSTRNTKFFLWSSQYTIVSQDLPGLQKIMAHITQDENWNPRANFIVYVEKITNSEIKHALKIFLNLNAYNVVILVTGEVTSIYTYFPFRDGLCGKTIGDVSLLGNCENFADARDCFPNKFINGLRNCTVAVVLLEAVPNIIFKSSNYTVYGEYKPGTEQYFLNEIAAKEGVTLRYIESKEKFGGIVLPNGTTTGLLHFLETGKADIATGNTRLAKNRADVFDYLWSANYLTYCLFTSAKRVPDWKKFYKEFDSLTWILILICYALITVVCVFTLNPTLRKPNDYICVFFQLYGFFFLGNSSTTLLAKKRLRIVLVCWIWLTFFLSNFYVTNLYSLASTHTKPTVDAFENNPNILNELPFKPCISGSMRTFFRVNDNFTFPENAFSDCFIPGKQLDIVASNSDLYTIDTKVNYIVNEYKYIDDEGKPKLDVWEFSNDYMMVSYLTRGFPLTDKFRTHAQHIFESGLIKRYLETLKIRGRSLLQYNSKKFKSFQLKDLRVHFFILGAGSSVAIIAFIFEIIIKTTFK